MKQAHRKLRDLLVLMLFSVFSIVGNADDAISTQVDIPYEMFRLDNGLTVLVHTDQSTPTVFVGMWYAVGSKDEPPGKTGFAHLFEHLMFQGTENREGEYFSPFTDAGATGMNGTTSDDRTNYYATVPSGALDMALWMESDRMSHLLGAVTQEALDEQRAVVQNEKRQGETRPYAKMGDKIREGLYPVGHPYRHSIIGSMDDLEAASLEDVHEWFNTYYGASNVVLVLAGDVTLEDAKSKVKHYFGAAPAGVPLSYPKKWVPRLTDNREEVMYDRVGVTRMTRVWALPGLNDKDTSLMYLVNDSLAGNKNSPLRKKLVDELQLATRVAGSAYGRVMSGEYMLTIDLRPGVNPEEVLSVVDATIAEYLETGPDPQLLENAKLSVNMYMLGALETGSSIGRLLAEGYLYSDDPLFINKELEWLNAANAEEIRQIAGRWLTKGYYQLTVLPFPEYSSSESDVDRSSIPAVTASSTINFPAIETATLKNGMKLVVATRGRIPLVDVSIQIDTGSVAAPADAPGIATFVFGLMDKGTRKYDANELAAERDKIGMTGQFRDDTERSSYEYRILRTYLEPSLVLAADMLRNPTFADEELGKYKARVSAYLANLEKAPSRAARSLFERGVYGADSPMGAVWTPQLLEQVDRAKLATFHGAEITPDKMTVYMIGDIRMEEARAAVNKALGKWSAKSKSARGIVGKAAPSRSRVILVDHPGAESSTIVAGHAIAPYDAERFTELSIMNRVLGGAFEARLNMNLREDKGWSYGYYSGIRTNASGDMTISASGQVQTDKTAASMQEVLRELSDYVSTRPVTNEELERVKLNRIRSLPGSFSTNRGFLRSIIQSDSYGLPLDYAESAAARIEAVTLDGIAARARDVIDPDKLTWLITGDLEKIEDSVRALDYGEVEVWDAFGNKLR
ncbi:MAG: insulinase family protein [Gammaproteobacteria bacterium]|nr:insulinase family protein [Gammaproteobacteria bacterium]NNL49237.1 insulinase family protein [Woeseiaceae bacterium]